MAVFMSDLMEVRPEWTDYNGHLNMAYYLVLFDQADDQFCAEVGLDEAYMRRSAHTTYDAEIRIRYRRELHAGARVRGSVQLLEVGPQSYHFCQELWHEDGWLAATTEGVKLHIDQAGPRVAPFPPERRTALDAALVAQGDAPRPDWVGQPMGIRR